MSGAYTLQDIADGLDAAKRYGAEVDQPEGARWVQLSDRLALTISYQLRMVHLTLQVEADIARLKAALDATSAHGLPPGGRASWKRGTWA